MLVGDLSAAKLNAQLIISISSGYSCMNLKCVVLVLCQQVHEHEFETEMRHKHEDHTRQVVTGLMG